MAKHTRPVPGSSRTSSGSRFRVRGVLLDADGALEGELRLDAEHRVLERGAPGTLGPIRTHERRLQGIALPCPVNGHTHLGDSVWTREPPRLPFAQVVAPPHGLKHRLLQETSAQRKREAMRRALSSMARLGIAATIDFREEGLAGVRLLRAAQRGTGVEAVIFGRALDPLDRSEVRRLLREADGLGISALRDLPEGAASIAREEVVRAGKRLALHASEAVWEPMAPVLKLHPDLLVHLCHATSEDLDAVRESGVSVAVCPRSNALFERYPPIAALEQRRIPFLLGTDNGMFQAPDLFREMEFAYLSCRARGEPVAPRSLVEAAFITPWHFLGRPECARLGEETASPALVLALPTDDPYYQVAARGAHRHLLVPGRSGPVAPLPPPPRQGRRRAGRSRA